MLLTAGVKSKVSHALSRLGYRLSRKDGDLRRLCRLFELHQVDLVLDVGACSGLYALELRRLGFRGKIISFEPLVESFAQLQRHANADQKWSCLKIALGSNRGEAILHISGKSASSSLLPMKARHIELIPQSRTIAEEMVLLETLDHLFPQIADGFQNVFLKLDTQGYEWQVLKGAMQSLQNICGIQIELSLVPLYDGERNYLFVLQQLEDAGFIAVDIHRGLQDYERQQLLQVDFVLVRKELLG